MKIEKILNNNIVTSFDEMNCEVVIMGKGIAFGRKKGDFIPDDRIEKVFRLAIPENNNKLIDIMEDIPFDHIEVADEIIAKAKAVLGEKLQESIYLSLIDHIHCAIERLNQNITYSNPLLWETKQYYPEEFKVGVESLLILKNRLGLRFPVDEAGFIALHLITAEYDTSMKVSMDIPRFVNSIISIVNETFDGKIKTDSLHYERFVTHIKFFAARVLQEEQIPNDDEEMFRKMIRESYQKSYQCAMKIKEYLQEEYDIIVSEEEMVYLTVHIQRICME